MFKASESTRQPSGSVGTGMVKAVARSCAVPCYLQSFVLKVITAHYRCLTLRLSGALAPSANHSFVSCPSNAGRCCFKPFPPLEPTFLTILKRSIPDVANKAKDTLVILHLVPARYVPFSFKPAVLNLYGCHLHFTLHCIRLSCQVPTDIHTSQPQTW